ncbi:MAG: GldG family protein [Gammaproteobacteria bacterium]|nr:GldG family protein [Gammaproteobacteria bacterium]
MEVSTQSRRALRFQSWAFVVLFLTVIGLLAWLSTRYNMEADWTASGRHTLSAASTALLKQLDGPVTLTSFSREDDLSGLRKRTQELVARYRRVKPEITLNFVDPDLEPERVRAAGITLDGELLLEYGGRRENLKAIGEQALTNALQRMLRSGERRVLFLGGHGERKIDGEANHDLGQWGRALTEQGFRFAAINLSVDPAIPADTAVLVLANPQTALLPGELQLVQEYLNNGGNLLWLSDPQEQNNTAALADQLGIHFLPGTLVDPTGQMLGIEHPAFVIVAEYPAHPVSEALTTLTLFPKAHAIELIEEKVGWRTLPLLNTLPRSWAELGKLEGSIAFDEGVERAGPLTIGMLLSRDLGEDEKRKQQRVAVLGDGDFLANSYLGNGANQELGNRLLNWLSHDDSHITIAPRTSPDSQLAITPMLSMLIGFGFLLVIPGLLIGSGLLIWWRRRGR